MQTSRKKSGDEKAILNYMDSVMFGKSRVLENQFSKNLICDMYKILKNDKNSVLKHQQQHFHYLIEKEREMLKK